MRFIFIQFPNFKLEDFFISFSIKEKVSPHFGSRHPVSTLPRHLIILNWIASIPGTFCAVIGWETSSSNCSENAFEFSIWKVCLNFYQLKFTFCVNKLSWLCINSLKKKLEQTQSEMEPIFERNPSATLWHEKEPRCSWSIHDFSLIIHVRTVCTTYALMLLPARS